MPKLKLNSSTKGMTLIEALVAVTILSLGMWGFSMLFMNIWKSNAFILEEGQSTQEGSRVLNNIISDIRKAKQADNGDYCIKSVGESDLVVYSNDDNDEQTERIHYFLDRESFELKKGVTNPAGALNAYSSQDESVEVIAKHIMNTPDQPVFSYYDFQYPGGTGAALTNPIVSNVRLVGIHLWINIKPETAPDNIKLESFAEIRNLNAN